MEILRRALQDLATRCALEQGAEIILDLLDADSRCTLIDVRSLGDQFTRLGFQPSWRMAIVGSPDDPSFAYFETIGRSHGMKVRLFKSRDAARFWLGAESQPDRTHNVR